MSTIPLIRIAATTEPLIGLPPGVLIAFALATKTVFQWPGMDMLIRIGRQYLFSGLWWMVVFPVVQPALPVIAVTLPGDWLRDALNPKPR